MTLSLNPKCNLKFPTSEYKSIKLNRIFNTKTNIQKNLYYNKDNKKYQKLLQFL